MSKITGKIIVMVAPSGGGKSTLIKRMKKDFPSLKESVSCTTRAPREGEANGVHYHFINHVDFESRIKANDFLEWAKVHNNYYGTSKQFVLDGLKSGAHLLFDIDVQGADALRSHFGSDANIIFIAPPSIAELEKRLRGRGTDNEETIAVRLKNAELELKRKNDYDHLIINDDLEKAYRQLSTIIEKILKD